MKIKTSILVIFTTALISYPAYLYSQDVNARAIANMKGTMPDSQIAGTVTFEETEAGLVIIADLANVPSPGKHGFHIHEKGDCSDDGKAAGGHYNPASVIHGHLPTDGAEKAHAGDMGNITINENGTGKLNLTLPGVHLTGAKNNVLGLSVILHEKADDFSQPTGNAGGRIGCGIITSADTMPIVIDDTQETPGAS
jgi:superoxide dismutase, Cu-Zn family